MGNQPPTDYPPPTPQTETPSTEGLSDGPPAASLCGFKLPDLPNLAKLLSGFKIPLPQLPELPNFVPAIGINCGNNNPIALKVEWGAGRPTNIAPAANTP